MARATTEQQIARRQRVEDLDLRGLSPSVIAREVGSDYRTVKRDLAAIAAGRARDADLTAERHRLLAAARRVEREAWGLFESLPSEDANGKLGSLTRVLQAHARAAAVVGHLEGQALAAEVQQLREEIAGLVTPSSEAT